MSQYNPSKRRAAAPQWPLLPRATFICSACETAEHCRTPTLPKDWAKETVGDDIFAYLSLIHI